MNGKAERHYVIDFHGWQIKVVATSYSQARYRALLKWREEYPQTRFLDFIPYARVTEDKLWMWA